MALDDRATLAAGSVRTCSMTQSERTLQSWCREGCPTEIPDAARTCSMTQSVRTLQSWCREGCPTEMPDAAPPESNQNNFWVSFGM